MSRIPRGLLAFNFVVLLAAVVGLVQTGNGEFVFYLVVLFILAAVTWTAHKRVEFSSGVLWGLSVWAAMHLGGGLITVPDGWPTNGDSRVLYSLWLIPEWFKYDHLVHAFGFGVTTFVCHQGLLATTGISETSRAGRWLILFAALASLGFGAMNELVEFVATILVPETNVGGYINTGWDLVANLVGVAIASMMLRIRSVS